MNFFQNTCKPEGVGGRLMVASMNRGHAAMAHWGMSHLKVEKHHSVLDVGCGGGANVKVLLELADQVTGVDYSQVSVEKSTKVNRKAIDAGRCKIMQANAMELPFPEGVFDLVTAFETVYFWPDLLICFQNIHRVLKPGGQFLICNEADGEHDKDNKWTEIIEGMTIYTAGQLEEILRQAGFSRVEAQKNGSGWLTVLAVKE